MFGYFSRICFDRRFEAVEFAGSLESALESVMAAVALVVMRAEDFSDGVAGDSRNAPDSLWMLHPRFA